MDQRASGLTEAERARPPASRGRASYRRDLLGISRTTSALTWEWLKTRGINRSLASQLTWRGQPRITFMPNTWSTAHTDHCLAAQRPGHQRPGRRAGIQGFQSPRCGLISASTTAAAGRRCFPSDCVCDRRHVEFPPDALQILSFHFEDRTTPPSGSISAWSEVRYLV
jgi:hypothetical protein